MSHQIDIDLLQYEPQLRIEVASSGGRVVWDPIRKKLVALTPEELLRQLMLLYCLDGCAYPAHRIRSEVGIMVNGMPRRCDIVVYSHAVEPWLVIECKSPKVALNQAVMEQAARYNLTLKAPYLAVTNGLTTYCAALDHVGGTHLFMEDFPIFGS
jgi:Type I restriction enzyme R protein N terminus (HSDR_N)